MDSLIAVGLLFSAAAGVGLYAAAAYVDARYLRDPGLPIVVSRFWVSARSPAVVIEGRRLAGVGDRLLDWLDARLSGRRPAAFIRMTMSDAGLEWSGQISELGRDVATVAAVCRRRRRGIVLEIQTEAFDATWTRALCLLAGETESITLERVQGAVDRINEIAAAARARRRVSVA